MAGLIDSPLPSSPTASSPSSSVRPTLDRAPGMPPGQGRGTVLFSNPQDMGANEIGSDPMVQTMAATAQIEKGIQQLVNLYPQAVSIFTPIQQQLREIVMMVMSQQASPAALAGAAPMIPPMQPPGPPGMPAPSPMSGPPGMGMGGGIG